MKRIGAQWVFKIVSLFSLAGLVTAYLFELPELIQGALLAVLVLSVILGQVRMGMNAPDRRKPHD